MTRSLISPACVHIQDLEEQSAVISAAIAAAAVATTNAAAATPTKGGQHMSLAEHRALVAKRLEAQREESARGVAELRADLSRWGGTEQVQQPYHHMYTN